MNLTDVDDKIIKRALEQGKTISEVTEPVVEIFHADREYLRIQPAEDYPKATDYIPQMIALVERLIARGVAYQAEDGSVYFAIDRFPGYGKLSRLDTREIRSGARVLQDDYTKENAQDFALWKAAQARGRGVGRGVGLAVGARASGLAPRVLGDGDGPARRDARPPLRRDRSRLPASRGRDRAERGGDRQAVRSRAGATARSCSPTARRWPSAWATCSPSKGCASSGVSAAALRHFVFNTHYRKELNLSDDALEASMQARAAGGRLPRPPVRPSTLDRRNARARRGCGRGGGGDADAALFDDLNAPEALAALFKFIRRANAELDRRGGDASGASSGRGRRSSGSTACSTSCRSELDVDPELAAVDRGAARCATGGASAAGLRRGRSDPRRADRRAGSTIEDAGVARRGGSCA